MNISIQKERDTPLLGRKRVTALIESTGTTPSRLDLLDALAKQLKVNVGSLVIRRIYSRFGETNIKVIAHVYTNADAKEKIEDPFMLKKHEKKAEAT